LFELQHQSHSDNGFFDIAAVCRVVQPIGNVLRCIPLAEFGRQMMLWMAPALWHQGIGEDMTKRPSRN
jgi:hypothetical protein